MGSEKEDKKPRVGLTLDLLKLNDKRAVFGVLHEDFSGGLPGGRVYWGYEFVTGTPEIDSEITISRKKWVDLGRPTSIGVRIG